MPKENKADWEVPGMLNGLEVAKHNSRESCWVIIKGKVYDVTDFLDDHPGGAAIILRYGGKNATSEYEPVHPAGTIEKNLSPDKHLGPIDMATVSTTSEPQVTRDSSETPDTPLAHCLNLDDVEVAAGRKIPRNAFVYLHSAADSLGSLENNRLDWKKVAFRPRVMRSVKRVSMTTTLFGQKSRLPFFIAPAARAKMVHEDGELCLARGAARWGIPYCPSTYSTIEHPELASAMAEENAGVAAKATPSVANIPGSLFFQLYVAIKKERTIELITMARGLGFKALLITVDTPVVGKREEDERYRAELATASGDPTALSSWTLSDPVEGEDAPVLRGHHSYTLNWHDLPWIKEAWGHPHSGPIALKGIQSPEDAMLAYHHGVDAVYLSNHGGRQCDDAPSSIRTLLEIRKFHPELLDKMEIYLDGGVRRGADVVKALCLGAKGVALGRPFMYSVAFGTEGVERVIRLLSEEIETTMRLIGATSLEQLCPRYVNTKLLERELPDELEVSLEREKLRSKL